MMNPKDLRSGKMSEALGLFNLPEEQLGTAEAYICLLYTSDAADE